MGLVWWWIISLRLLWLQVDKCTCGANNVDDVDKLKSNAQILKWMQVCTFAVLIAISKFWICTGQPAGNSVSLFHFGFLLSPFAFFYEFFALWFHFIPLLFIISLSLFNLLWSVWAEAGGLHIHLANEGHPLLEYNLPTLSFQSSS